MTLIKEACVTLHRAHLLGEYSWHNVEKQIDLDRLKSYLICLVYPIWKENFRWAKAFSTIASSLPTTYDESCRGRYLVAWNREDETFTFHLYVVKIDRQSEHALGGVP